VDATKQTERNNRSHLLKAEMGQAPNMSAELLLHGRGSFFHGRGRRERGI
jgi:hypothetical protein